MRIIDLSVELRTGMPAFPRTQRAVVTPFSWHSDPTRLPGAPMTFASTVLLLSDHTGTHCDAPTHCNPSPQALSIEQIPLETFYRTAVCLDMSGVPSTRPITRADLDESSRQAGLTVEKGTIVLLYTGHYDRAYGTSAWFAEHTGLGAEAVDWLAEREVPVVGIDIPTIDATVATDQPGHQALRDHRFLHIENLTNLDQVAGRRFQFVGFPLKIAQGTASPIRAVAILED